uniref:Ig-like domain-containing protein n=1 Tax=Catharus ustulatus TaxID=91951 RepID=A0A8C3UJ62_CATUS
EVPKGQQSQGMGMDPSVTRVVGWPCPVVALAGWCPLSPAGAQTPQLLVEPPWTPAVLWDRVTLTCQGSGTAGDTTWYKDGRRWWQEGPDSFTSGTYQCQRPGTGLSPPVTVSDGERAGGPPCWNWGPLV